MELIPDADAAPEHMQARALVISQGSNGDCLHVINISSGAQSLNMLPPGHTVSSIVASAARPEHVLLFMSEGAAGAEVKGQVAADAEVKGQVTADAEVKGQVARGAEGMEHVYRLDLTTGAMTLDTRNPGFVTQVCVWVCVCVCLCKYNTHFVAVGGRPHHPACACMRMQSHDTQRFIIIIIITIIITFLHQSPQPGRQCTLDARVRTSPRWSYRGIL